MFFKEAYQLCRYIKFYERRAADEELCNQYNSSSYERNANMRADTINRQHSR